MSTFEKKHIEILRNYLLSDNEVVRQTIKAGISSSLLKYLYIIEEGFLQNVSIGNISSKIEAPHLLSDLKELQNEYYLKLERAFEREIASAIQSTERQAFKIKFHLLDSQDEFKLEEFEIKFAITSVERDSIREKLETFYQTDEVTEKVAALIPSSTDTHPTPVVSLKRTIRFVVAASVIGLIFFGGYLILNNNRRQDNSGTATIRNQKDSLKEELVKILPTIDENITEKRLLVPESFGFAKEHEMFLTIITQDIEKQIDTLRKIYSTEQQGVNDSGYGPIAKRLYQKIDSLIGIRNTYTYDLQNRKILLRLKNNQKVGEIISIEPSKKTAIFIQINRIFYELLPTSKPLKLSPVKNKRMLDELEKIVFQNS